MEASESTFLHRDSLVRSRPGQHRHRHRLQGFVSDRSELEVCSERNGSAHASFKRDDLLTIALLAPHLSVAFKNVPDPLDRPVRDRYRCRSRREFKMRHAAACQPQKDAHVGLVRGDTVGRYRKALGTKLAHCPALFSEPFEEYPSSGRISGTGAWSS